jgi:hypothetical protein
MYRDSRYLERLPTSRFRKDDLTIHNTRTTNPQSPGLCLVIFLPLHGGINPRNPVQPYEGLELHTVLL